jgi:hypothetical protein
MLTVMACNVTHEHCNGSKPTGKPMLAREDGTADYEIEVCLNARVIWRGSVNGHVRDAGAGALLRLIADKIDEK